jgi:hypothetical protein
MLRYLLRDSAGSILSYQRNMTVAQKANPWLADCHSTDSRQRRLGLSLNNQKSTVQESHSAACSKAFHQQQHDNKSLFTKGLTIPKDRFG